MSTSRGVKSTSRRTKLNRVPRTPASCSLRSSASVTSLADGRHAARPAAGRLERIDERAIVAAVAGRLHDHVPGETEVIAQREQLLLRRVAGRVLPLGRVGELDLRARTRGSVRRRRRAAARSAAWTGSDGMAAIPESLRTARRISLERRPGRLQPFHGVEHAIGLASPSVAHAGRFPSNTPASARSAIQA